MVGNKYTKIMIPRMLLKLKFENFPANSPNTSFSILFDLESNVAIVIRSTLLSHLSSGLALPRRLLRKPLMQAFISGLPFARAGGSFRRKQIRCRLWQEYCHCNNNPKTNLTQNPLHSGPGTKGLFRKAHAANPPTLPPERGY